MDFLDNPEVASKFKELQDLVLKVDGTIKLGFTQEGGVHPKSLTEALVDLKKMAVIQMQQHLLTTAVLQVLADKIPEFEVESFANDVVHRLEIKKGILQDVLKEQEKNKSNIIVPKSGQNFTEN